MLNPLRSEQEAFRFLLYVLVVAAVVRRARLPPPRPVSADLELAERAARAAGEVLLSYYGRPPEGVAVEVVGHRPGARTPTARPSARSASCSSASGPTTAWWPRRARARRPPAGGAGWSTRSTARSTSSTASRPGRSASRWRTPTGLPWAWCTRRSTARPSARCAARARFLGDRRLRVRDPRPLDAVARGHRLLLRARPPRRPGRGDPRACSPAPATSAAPAPRRSTWPGWPPGASTPSSSAACSTGTGPPGACWWRRPAAASAGSTTAGRA